MQRKPTNARAIGLKYGFRSGLEEQVARQMEKAGVPVAYEALKLGYVRPAFNAKYAPDFILPNGIVIETKGRFLTEDRQKHLLIKTQHPDIDIRFVFSNSKQTISKGSKTSYAAWCEKHGFQYADRFVPTSWLEEPACLKRLAAIKEATA